MSPQTWALLRRLKSPTARLLPQALLVGLGVEVGLRTLRLPRLARLLGISVETTGGLPGVPATPARLGVWDACRYNAARHVLRLWPDGGSKSCLRLALIAGFLLRHRHPIMCIGVAQIDGQTRAHAWISVDGMVFDRLAGTYQQLTAPVR